MPDQWLVKRFAEQEGARESLLRVDLRLPAVCDAADFERLLGQACFWLREAPADAEIVIGQQRFKLADGRRGVETALAVAIPESVPPAGAGGIVLSLGTV